MILQVGVGCVLSFSVLPISPVGAAPTEESKFINGVFSSLRLACFLPHILERFKHTSKIFSEIKYQFIINISEEYCFFCKILNAILDILLEGFL